MEFHLLRNLDLSFYKGFFGKKQKKYTICNNYIVVRILYSNSSLISTVRGF